MASWYGKIAAEPDEFQHVMDACEHFEREHEAARSELKLDGKRIESVCVRLPGLLGWRFEQLQELEAILVLLELRENKTKTERRKFYMEHYNRDLSDNVAKNYAENDPTVCAMAELRMQVAYVRNKYLALMKHYEALQYQVGHVVRLRAAGMEDATIRFDD